MLLFALHLWLTRGVLGPTVVPDETGHLGNARWLSGDPNHILMPNAPFYGLGYPLLLAPFQWAIDDADQRFRSVLAVNAAVMATLLPLTYCFCRQVLEAPARVSLVAAGAASLVPMAITGPAYAFAENLVLPLCVVLALAFWWFVTEQAPWKRMLLGPTTALLFMTHSRFLVVLIVTIVAIAAATWLRVAPWRIALANGGLLIGLLLIHAPVREAVLADRWVNGTARPEGSAGDAVRVLTDPSLLYHFLVEASGQAWYVVAGSLGVAALGIAHILLRLRQRPLIHPRRLALAFLLTAGLAVFAVSTIFFTRLQLRADHLVYGRHNDSFMPMWVAAGVVFVLSDRRARSTVWVGAASVGLVIGSLAWLTLGQDVDRFAIGLGSSLNVPALHSPIDLPGAVASELTIAAVVMLTLVTLVAVTARPRWRAGLVAAAVAWYIAAGISVIDKAERASELQYENWPLPTQIQALGVREAAIRADGVTSFAALIYQWYLPDVRFEPYVPGRESTATEPYVFAPLDDLGLRRSDARVALIDEGGVLSLIERPEMERGFALWVLPGPEQDRLAGASRLLPEEFPAALPPEALRADIFPARPAVEPIVIGPGEQAEVDVRGRHDGRGSPWPDVNSFHRQGRVRVGARLIPTTPMTGAAPVTTYAELPRWLWPGDQFEAAIPLSTFDDRLRPLPSGRYRVEVAVVQEGFTDISAPGRWTTLGVEVELSR